MQIVPGSWSWVEDTLTGHPLDPSSPQENVHVGVMYLGQLIADAGGDVMALRSRFGG